MCFFFNLNVLETCMHLQKAAAGCAFSWHLIQVLHSGKHVSIVNLNFPWQPHSSEREGDYRGKGKSREARRIGVGEGLTAE